MTMRGRFLIPFLFFLLFAGAGQAAAQDGVTADSSEATPPRALAQAEEPVTLSPEELAEILIPIPNPDLEPLEDAVREVVNFRRQSLQSEVASGEVGRIVEAYGELGFLFHAHELWPAAIAAYANADALAPQDPRWTYAIALALKEANELDQAAAAYERALDVLPHNPAAIIALAEIRLEQNQPEWAKALLRFALEVSAESPAALATMGQVALSQKRYARAVQFLERALAQQPAATRLHYPLALAYRGLGELDKAKEELALRGEVGVRPPDPIRDTIEERKTGERVMLLEGRRAFAAGRPDLAITFFQKALEADPSSLRARVNLAAAVATAGDPDQAVSIYREVLELEPENSAALFNLGLLMVQNGDLSNGIPLLEKAAKADQDDAEVRLQLARALGSQGRLEDALRWADEAVSAQPANQGAWILAANIEKALGRFREARERLEDGARQMPGEGLLIHDLARLLAASPDLSQRNGEQATQLAYTVANSAPTPRHLETLALALGETGRCTEAVEALRLAVQNAGESPEAQRLGEMIPHFESGPPCRPLFPGQ